MKQVDIYNDAIAIAQASVGNPNQVVFEAAMANKAVELGLNQGEYNMFAQEARNVRSKLMQYKTQDDAAARSAKVAAPQAQAQPAQAQPIAQAKPAEAAPAANAS